MPRLTNRWAVLGLVFLARTSMGIQFFVIPPLLPLFVETWGISYAQAGLLISIAMFAGILLALPTGLLSQRFGDKTIFVVGLALQAIGAAMLTQADGFALAITARALTGVGLVFLNVLATKIVTDWFAGRELATSMAILVSSWPFGAAVALVATLPLSEALGWRGTIALVAAISAVFFLAMLALYRDSPSSVQQTDQAAPLSWNLHHRELGMILLAALVWSLPNVGFVIFNGFTPALLQEWGMAAATVGVLVSLVSWISIPGIAVGGWLTDRTGRVNTIIVLGVLVCGGFILMVAQDSLLWVAAVGIGIGTSLWPGAIMSLPVQVLSPASRATGFGVFYTVFYGMATFLPPIAGWVRDVTGTITAPLYFGAACFAATLLPLALLRLAQARVKSRPEMLEGQASTPNSL